jgi:hypothetical protein
MIDVVVPNASESVAVAAVAGNCVATGRSVCNVVRGQASMVARRDTP